MDILFWRPSKRRRRNFWESDSDDYLDFLDDSDSDMDDMDQNSDISRSHSPTSRVSTPELQLSSTHPEEVPSLVNCAAKIVAKHVTCAEIETHDPPLDESMLKKIAFWAFPQDESHVKVFSQFTLHGPYVWNDGERKVKERMIKKIRQVGFMVAAFVETRERQDAKVSLTFEKQHLTSTSCSACSDSVFCQHIIAVVLERIRHGDKVPVHAPVTETLSTLTRDQLQKLMQYAINEDPGGILGRVFQHIDEIRDINSEVNMLAGAPDPTFGMFPEDKSTWDLSLEKLKKKLITDLADGFNSYKDTCDVFIKSKTGFYDKYFKRVTDLINKNEIEYAGKVLISIAETTSNVPNFRWSTATNRVFLDVERMVSCFIACYSGQIRQDMVIAALSINKRMKSEQSNPLFIQPKQWSEMSSIKLQTVGDNNLGVVSAMEAEENRQFYEPLVASVLPETPQGLQQFYDDEIHLSDVVYYEPLDVMMFRLECIVQYHQWTDDYSCRLKICKLGALILQKLTELSDNFSILAFDKKRTEVLKSITEKEDEHKQDNEVSEPPLKKARRSRKEATNKSTLKKRSSTDSIQTALLEIKEDMRRATEDKLFEGLTQGQLCYSMLYICFKMWQTLIMSDQNSNLQKILMEATVRVFELARFRYFIPMEVKEVSWWEQLMEKILNYMRAFSMYEHFQEITERYCQAMLRSKLDFYDKYLPLPLIDLLLTFGGIPYTDQLNLSVEVLCYSQTPIYPFSFTSTGHDYSLLLTDYSSESEKTQLKNSIIKKYKTMLSQVFAVKSELPEQSEAARRVLWHLESVKDGEYVVAAYNCIKTNVENIVEKEDKLVLLSVLLNCIKECNTHGSQNGLYTQSTSVLDTLIFLSKSLTEEFTKYVLPLWSDISKYFQKHHLKSLLSVISRAVKESPSLITDMSSTLQKYFTSSFKHERECCAFIKIFFPNEAKRYQILKKIVANAANYSTSALLRIGKTEYKMLSSANPGLTVFNKEVYKFLILGLQPLRSKDKSVFGYGSNLHLNSKEMKYLRWYFGMIASALNKEIVKTDQYKKLMSHLKDVLKRDVKLMLDFYQAMEGSAIGIKETKAQFGSELVVMYLKKFESELSNCNHTYYTRVLELMKEAMSVCQRYVPDGANVFGLTVITRIRQSFKSKRKLMQLMDQYFPDYLPPKKVDKKKKSDPAY